MTDAEIHDRPKPAVAYEDAPLLRLHLTGGFMVSVARRDSEVTLRRLREWTDRDWIRVGDREFRPGQVIMVEHLRTPGD